MSFEASLREAPQDDSLALRHHGASEERPQRASRRTRGAIATMRLSMTGGKQPEHQGRIVLRIEGKAPALATPGDDIPGKRLGDEKLPVRGETPFVQRQDDLAGVRAVRIEVHRHDDKVAAV